jgi:predicted Zn finger-like uncharacterized protein
MKVTCPSCGAKYAIADEKVRGRRVKVRCKSCTTPIVVDGNALEADAAAAALGGADDDEATRVAHPIAPATAEWSVNLSDTDQRTMSADEIIAGWHSGLIREDAFVWKDGMDDWKPVLDVPELAAHFFERRPSSPAAAVAPAVSSAPWHAPSGNGAGASAAGGFGLSAAVPAAASRPAAAARVSGGRAHGREDLFSKASQAGNEAELGDRQSAPGSTPYEEAKPTGARNENSVLFSLDALKAGFTPSAQAAPAPARGSSPKRSSPTASSSSAAGSTSMDDLMSIGGASQNALFGFNANHALMHAPPPPEPPPPPPPSLAVPSSFGPTISGPGVAPRSNKLVLALAAAVAILLIVGVGLAVVIGSGKSDEIAQLEKEKQALEEAEAKRKAAAEREREEAKKREAEAKKEEARPAESEAQQVEAEMEAKKEAGRPITEEDRKRYAEAQKKKAEEAKVAKTEPETKPVEVKKEQSSGVATFNKSAAISALSSAASAASGCKRPDGPTGTGKAVVTFAPSGSVTSASVSGGSFGGTSVGGCIASVFRRAKVPPFEGGAVTVSKSFSIAP